MPRQNYLFTSESVSEGHPDKVCDRVSDTVVDAYLAAMPEARVACETLATTNRVVIAGEVRGPASITPDHVIAMTREAIRDAFDRLRPLSDYDALYAAARCRSEADWAWRWTAISAFCQ